MANRVAYILTFWFVFCTWATPIVVHAQKLYFGKKYEAVTHVGIHLAIGLWRPDYSLVAAISIETAQTISSGKFEADDLAYRVGGALAGYIIKKGMRRKTLTKIRNDYLDEVSEEDKVPIFEVTEDDLKELKEKTEWLTN